MTPLLRALALAALATACGDGQGPLVPGADWECTARSDCLDGQVCEAGVCIADRPNPMTVSLQVRPPAPSGLLKQQFQRIDLLEGRRLPDLLLARPVTLTGLVRVAVSDNPLARSVPGRVLLSRRSVIPGTSVRFDALAEDGAGYEVRVVPGSYDLSVFPDNEEFPPFREDGFEVRQETVRDVFLPEWRDYGRLAGRVVVREGDGRGVPGIRVIALSADATRLSTEDVTADDGRFTLTLPPVEDAWTVRLAPTDLNPLFPTVDLPDVEIPQDGELGDLALGAGDDPPVEACLRVIGDGGPLAGTTVELESEQGNGVLARTATTDEKTEVLRIALLPGSYALRTVPPIDSDFAVTRLADVRVGPADGAGCQDLGDVHLELKRSYEGVLFQAGDMPAPDVTLEALLTGNGDVKGLHRRVLATTHQDGRFLLRVDPGLHDLTFIPPDRSGLPRWTEHGVEIRKNTERAETLHLKDPDLIRGVVRSPDGYPLPDATVDVYLLAPDGADATLIGLGTTDVDGGYAIVLPNP